MVPLTYTFNIPAFVLKGLSDGSYTRMGGVIQERSTGRIVTWLRDANPAQSAVLGSVSPAASALTLGVAVAGFAVIQERLKNVENSLQAAQQLLEKIDHKVDLSFYSSLLAAIDLAKNAVMMNQGENRKRSAFDAVKELLRAEHVYTEYFDTELEKGTQICGAYLLTLCFAYIAEARCYLEMDEVDTAIRRLEEGGNQVRSRAEKYIDLLLTTKPIVYLHPELKDDAIDLSRLTKIYQWKDPQMDENAVFEALREDSGFLDRQFEQCNNTLPVLIAEPSEAKGGMWNISNVASRFFGSSKEVRTTIAKKLSTAMKEMETMIETTQRFEGYKLELKSMRKLGLKFNDWLNLVPTELQSPGQDVACIFFKKPESKQ